MHRRSNLSYSLLLVAACGGEPYVPDATAVERSVLTHLSLRSPLGLRTLGHNFAFEWTVGLELAGEDSDVATLVVVFGVTEAATRVTRDLRGFEHCILGSVELSAHASGPTLATESGVFDTGMCTRDLGSDRLQPFVLVGPPSDMTLTADENRARFEKEARLLSGGEVVAPHCETGSDHSCRAPISLDRSSAPTPFVRNLVVPEVVGVLPGPGEDPVDLTRAHLEATADVGVWGHDDEADLLPGPLQLSFFVRHGDVTVPLRVESRREDLAALLGDPAADFESRLGQGLRLESHELPARGEPRSVSASLFFPPDAGRTLQSETPSVHGYGNPPQELIACLGPADTPFEAADIDTDAPRCQATELLLLSTADRARLQSSPMAIVPDMTPGPARAGDEDSAKSRIPSYSQCIQRIPDWYQCAPYGHAIIRPLERSRGSTSVARARLSMGPYFGVGRSAQPPADADISAVTELLASPCGAFVTMYLMSLDTPCPVTVVTMKMGADVRTWGKHVPSMHVLDASARGNITMDDDGTRYAAVGELSFFGHRLAYHPAPAAGSDSASGIQIPGLADLPSYSKKFCKEGDDIHKWGVDMKFQLCARGTVGLVGDGTLYPDTVSPDDGGTTNHSLGDQLSPSWADSSLAAKSMFRTHVTPYATIDLVAEAGASASILSLSLNGTVHLADFRLSDHRGSSNGAAADLLVGLRMDESETPPRPTALVHQLGTKAYLHGSFLDGRLDLHARVDLGFCKPHHTWTLASWNGFDWYRKIYEKVSDFDSVDLSGSD